MVQEFVAVFLVLALLFGSLWLLRQKSLSTLPLLTKKNSAKQMKVIERVALTPHHSLHLVAVGESTLLVGVSPTGCHSLTSFGSPSIVFNDTMGAGNGS